MDRTVTATQDPDMARAVEVVKRVLNDYAQYPPSYGEVTMETVFDEERGHYELMQVGWNGWKRIHGCLIHVDIHEGKVWIQHDGTEEGIANDLVEAGIPKEKIVLAFRHPEIRKHSGFAVV